MIGNGQAIVLTFSAIFVILFLVDLAIIVYQREKELYDEYKRYERREMKRLLKEYYEEQGKLSRYDIAPKRKRGRK